MIQEQIYDVASWWKDQEFNGKEYYSVDEEGAIWLKTPHIKERQIGSVSLESGDVVIRNLQEKFAGYEMKVKDFETEWVAAEDKLKLADKLSHLKDTLLNAAAIGDLESLMTLVLGWENAVGVLVEENFRAKLKLVELAEENRESTNWKEATQIFRDISEKWKQTGYLDKSRNDALFNRIDAAKKTFFDRKKLHSDDEEKEMLQNLDLKIELVDKAEALVMSEEWKNTTEVFHKLMDEWKSIGKTMHKRNEELWQRFITAKNTFFERKSRNFDKIKLEQEANYIIKLALVERAEALRESTDWFVTPQAFATIMEEWKKSGRLSQEKSDELWKRLTAAQDQFFEAKKKANEESRQFFQANYNIKAALLKRAEEIKNSSNWGSATEEFQELMEEWKKSGPLSKTHNNKMWEAFLDARKHFFARKDADREDRKQYAETQKAFRVEQEKQLHQELIKQIKEEEEKLQDFKAGILNITPGKKSDELKRHLEKLIVETTEYIDKLRKKAGLTVSENK